MECLIPNASECILNLLNNHCRKMINNERALFTFSEVWDIFCLLKTRQGSDMRSTKCEGFIQMDFEGFYFKLLYIWLNKELISTWLIIQYYNLVQNTLGHLWYFKQLCCWNICWMFVTPPAPKNQCWRPRGIFLTKPSHQWQHWKRGQGSSLRCLVSKQFCPIL